MLRTLTIVVAILCLLGCKTRTVVPYIAPRVTGRVLDADTQHPLAKVKVTRGNLDQSLQAKGGELLIRKPPAISDRDGYFVLGSQRALTPFRAGWHSVRLTFDLAEYEQFRTNYTITASTNSPTGEPVVNTGNILLHRTLKLLPLQN